MPLRKLFLPCKIIWILTATLALAGCGEQDRAKNEWEANNAKEKAEKQEKCKNEMTKNKSTYNKFFTEKKYWDAVLAVTSCADATNDKELKDMVAKADILYQESILNNKKSTLDEKERALSALEKDYPEAAEKYKTQKIKIENSRTKEAKASQASRRGNTFDLYIGMESSRLEEIWGIPDDINKQVSQTGTIEQWIYRSGFGKSVYVYFQNGKLSSYQH